MKPSWLYIYIYMVCLNMCFAIYLIDGELYHPSWTCMTLHHWDFVINDP